MLFRFPVEEDWYHFAGHRHQPLVATVCYCPNQVYLIGAKFVVGMASAAQLAFLYYHGIEKMFLNPVEPLVVLMTDSFSHFGV